MILGLHGALGDAAPTFCHNAGYCLIDPDTAMVVRLVEEDKLQRVKNTGRLDRADLVRDLGVDATSLSIAVSHFTPTPERTPRTSLPLIETAEVQTDSLCGAIESYRTGLLGVPATAYLYMHELAHVFTAFAYRPFESSDFLGLVVEGCGSFAQSSLFQIKGQEVRLLDYNLPIFTGNCFQQWLAEVVLGIPRCDHNARHAAAGKLMALAAYGDSRKFQPSVRRFADMLRRREYFDYRSRVLPHFAGKLLSWSEKVDLCAAVQMVFEERLLRELHDIRDRFGKQPLLYSGGCALSIKANSRVREIFPDTIIPPNCGDDGQPLGLAAAHLFLAHNKSVYPLNHQSCLMTARARFDCTEGTATDDTLCAAADLLHTGEILAFVQGTMPEIGPRALGRRSLLADPRAAHIRAILNYIKGREYYRPLGAVVLHDQAEQFFDGYFFSPYMLYDFPVRQAVREAIEGCVHEDGTTRVQSVLRDGSTLARLLERRADLGLPPVLINTSLNRQGSPIAFDELSVRNEMLGLGIKWALIGGRLRRLDADGRLGNPSPHETL